MTFSSYTSLSNSGAEPSAVFTSFSDHKYLLLAILTCMQSRIPQRKVPHQEKVAKLVTRRLLSDNLSEREGTPCIVLRDSLETGGPIVAVLALDNINLSMYALSECMRKAVPPSLLPDKETLHFAMASTLPGIPALFLSIGSNGENFSHTWHDALWTQCHDNTFLLHAIHYANLVGTSIELDTNQAVNSSEYDVFSGIRINQDEDHQIPKRQVSGFNQLAQVYNHVAVHAAIAELRAFRQSQLRGNLRIPLSDEPQSANYAGCRKSNLGGAFH